MRPADVHRTWQSSASAYASVPPASVWDALVDGRRWSLWNPDIEWLWLEGPVAPGVLATIKFTHVRQTALLITAALAPEHLSLALTIGPVARLRVSWMLTKHEAGTRIGANVETSGPGAGILLKRPAQRIAAALPQHLESLAAYAADPRPLQTEDVAHDQ